MIVKLLTEHHLEFLSLKGGCTGSSESTLVKMSNCLKSHATAQIYCQTTATWLPNGKRLQKQLCGFKRHTLLQCLLLTHADRQAVYSKFKPV